MEILGLTQPSWLVLGCCVNNTLAENLEVLDVHYAV